MKKQITTIIIGIALLSLVSAYYAGDVIVYDLNEEIINCLIYNNNSNLEGLNLSWNNTEIIIDTEVNYKPDSFTVGCFTWKSYFEEDIVSGGSSGGGGTSCYKSWVCGNWSECIDNFQNRTCELKYIKCNFAKQEIPVFLQTCEDNSCEDDLCPINDSSVIKDIVDIFQDKNKKDITPIITLIILLIIIGGIIVYKIKRDEI